MVVGLFGGEYGVEFVLYVVEVEEGVVVVEFVYVYFL